MTTEAKIQVLCVDDEPMLLDLTKTFLEREGGVEVEICDDSGQALRKVRDNSYDVIVSDYQMPGLDGISFLKAIRSMGIEIPFVVFTGRGRESVAMEALNNGADFYLHKGGDPRSQFAELNNVINLLYSRRRSQMLLSRSEDRYRAFISATRTGAWEYDHQTGQLWLSPEYLKMLDYDPALFSPNPGPLQTWVDLMHPDDREASTKAFQDYLESGSQGMYETYFRVRCKDGDYIWVCSRGQTLLDKDGRNSHITVGTHIDIDLLKRLEEDLREEKNRFRDLADNGKTLIWSSDTSGGCYYFNKPWLDFTGRTLEQEYGNGWAQGVHPEDFDRCLEIYTSAFSKRVPFGMMYRLRRHDGSYRWIQDDGTPRWTDKGEFLGYIGHCFDVHDLRLMEESLLLTNKKLHLLSSLTRHDILNQLTTLRGFLDLALDDSEEETIVRYLQKCESAASSIQRQIEFTRQYEELGVKKPIWQCLEKLWEEIPVTLLHLEHRVKGLELFADPMLDNAFRNLVDNTIRHADGATRLDVFYEVEQDGHLRLIIQDDGPGIEDDQKEIVFNKGVGKNTGLGLFFVREILSMTGISIRENGELGKGARFEITVPVDRYRFS
ncbi:MAG: PAS domain-containing protein [Candidatus Methanomethylophilaceae archaeon]|nr:PAS domain-containing protein [Candidatus Methanomethylophilaceae archaeon]